MLHKRKQHRPLITSILLGNHSNTNMTPNTTDIDTNITHLAHSTIDIYINSIWNFGSLYTLQSDQEKIVKHYLKIISYLWHQWLTFLNVIASTLGWWRSHLNKENKYSFSYHRSRQWVQTPILKKATSLNHGDKLQTMEGRSHGRTNHI